MKKTCILLIAACMLFCSCAVGPPGGGIPGPTAEVPFISENHAIFPFYCIGVDDQLWRVQSNGSLCSRVQVNYSLQGQERNYVYPVPGTDTVLYATDLIVENGIVLCSLGLWSAPEAARNLAENVRFDSLCANEAGSVLFIDRENSLYLYQDGMAGKIEEEVAQAIFVDEETFLYRLAQGEYIGGEFSYPVYWATADYRNYLMSALDIAAVDSSGGRAFLIKNRHTVQKRAATAEVAECFVYADGEILFRIPSVPLSQFREDTSHMVLLSCDEAKTTLQYNLFRIDGDEPALMASAVLSGRYVSSDRTAFVYETAQEEMIKTNLLTAEHGVMQLPSGEALSLENIFYCAPHLYLLTSGTLSVMDVAAGGEFEELAQGFSSAQLSGNSLICFQGSRAPYGISACSGKSIMPLTSSAADDTFFYEGGYLYYYTGEGGFYNISMAAPDGEEIAYISNVDTQIGFIAGNTFVAAVKRDDKSLYIAHLDGFMDTKIKIKKIISDREVR